MSLDVTKDCLERYSIKAEEKDIVNDLTPKDVYSSWQASVMKHLPDFAYITSMVVDQKTRKFLSNQNAVMKNHLMSTIKNVFFDRPGKYITFYIQLIQENEISM